MTVVENAYAKINLFLDVTERREDGYHNIVSVMQSVSLCDTLTFMVEKSETTNIFLTTDDPHLPIDKNNLIYISAIKYLSYFKINANVEVHLEKRIPTGAGLGGGSSDAAATLRALDKVFGVATNEELLTIASEIGSDVPFCLVGGKALCTGRGEKMERFSQCDCCHLVVAIGQERVSTPEAYSKLDKKYNNFANNSYKPQAYTGQYYNIFESVTKSDEISKIKESMSKNGAEICLMSGSGPAVFGIFKTESNARQAAYDLVSNGFSAYLCQSFKGEL